MVAYYVVSKYGFPVIGGNVTFIESELNWKLTH